MDDNLRTLYEKLRASYERLIPLFENSQPNFSNFENRLERTNILREIKNIATQIYNIELNSIDKETKQIIANSIRAEANETNETGSDNVNIDLLNEYKSSLSMLSSFLYNDSLDKNTRITKFFIFKTQIDNLYKYEFLAKGGKRTAPAYKLNGEKVSLLINKKKLHRSVYVKGNGKAKYCKINYEFVLLSKLKNKIL